MAKVATQEKVLTAYALRQLQTVPGLTLYGESNWRRVEEGVGVIPFNLTGIPHGLVAAILGCEGGIGVRNGCFCAHPYVVHLLGLTLMVFALLESLFDLCVGCLVYTYIIWPVFGKASPPSRAVQSPARPRQNNAASAGKG
jgi:selenocysteine lyase/cysteine desulfurase